MSHSGTLYIVPTPIGNLEDMTLRGLRILKEVDYIAAEDTRHTKKLLNHFGIPTPLISYYREKEIERSVILLGHLLDGKDIALVSDAGTPVISDPGAILVKKAHEEGVKVVPLAGPSAVTTALSGSGLIYDGFIFLGFPPVKKGARKKIFKSILNSEFPVVFYESPKRITSFLEDAIEILGNRQGFWARELTKSYEELISGTLDELLAISSHRKNKGEFVLIVCPGEKEEVSGETVEELIVWYRDKSALSLKDASRKISSDLGLSRSAIYKQALSIWKSKNDD